MKRIRFALALLAAGLSAGLGGCDPSGGKPRIGVALFSVDDSFVSAARRALEAAAQGKARLSVLDGQNQQAVQNSQIDAMIADKASAIIINPVDPSAMGALVFRAKASGVPVVFFSHDPSAVAVSSWDKAFFVGVKTEEAEALQVEILADYWRSQPGADKDGDGRLQYVLIRGQSEHQDVMANSAKRQKSFEDAGVPAIKLAETVADWTRIGARQKLTDLIRIIGAKRIEAVLCANDEMALGAIESLKVGGYFKSGVDFVPVVGVDGTRFALDAIADGSLLGTVRGDAERQGKTVFDLAYTLATGGNPLAAGWTLTEGKYALVPYRKVTKENLKDFTGQ
jgi:methyl-galactoside transport system substrate-binding protein